MAASGFGPAPYVNLDEFERRLRTPRRIGRTASAIEDNIETHCSIVHGRSPASAKARSRFKANGAIARDQAPASSI